VVAAVSLEFADELHTPEIERAVQEVETRIRRRHPEVVALFVKPQSRIGFTEAVRAGRGGLAFTVAGAEQDGCAGDGLTDSQ
jgi:hypothetical protein